jgi:molybdenum cofactor cytidylyltransferase
MKLEQRPVAGTVDTILAHSIKHNGLSLRKGHVIRTEDIPILQQQGYETLVVVVPGPGDIGEDQAAFQLARLIPGENISIDKPFTGRCNLKASVHGLAIIDQAAIEQINLVHESVTIATLQPYAVVSPDQLVATVKVIPFFVAGDCLEECKSLAGRMPPAIHIAPFTPKSIGFIQTRLPGMKESILDKTAQVLSHRLELLHSSIADEIRCKHATDDLADAITQHLETPVDIIIIAGASAIIDRDDMVPAAIRQAGGNIIHFGMPVDPGNLLLLARHGQRPVLGLPGCARSPSLNGFDWILERLIADISITSRDIMRMGTGGLLKEINTRPQPRLGSDKT